MSCFARLVFGAISYIFSLGLYAQERLTPKQFCQKYYPELDFYEVKSIKSPKSELTKENCFYVIRHQYDIQGEIISLPKRSVLYFVDNAGFHHGSIELSDDCHLIGGVFIFSQGDLDVNLYSDLYMSSPIIAVDASNVSIENCSFNYIPNGDKPDPAIIIYGKAKECNNVIIKDNKFLVSGIAFFCEVKNSTITGNLFEQSIRALRVETMYDKKPFRSPTDILINNNTILGQDRILPRPQGWISGVYRLSFTDNFIESSSDGLFLYCGDGNIALDSVIVSRNHFVMRKDEALHNQPKCCILVRGKSYPFQKKGLTLGRNVVISDNTFTSNEICKDSKNRNHKAIEVNFVNDIKIMNNIVKDFSNFVGLTDDFRGLYERCSSVIIDGNHIYSTFNNPIRVSSDIKKCEILNNKFHKCNVDSDYQINLKQLSVLRMEDNVITVPGNHSKKVISVKHRLSVRNKENTVRKEVSN